MPAPTVSHNLSRLSVVATGPRADLAADLVAQHLDLSLAEAQDRLDRGPGVLAESVETGRARALAVLLHLLGLRVRVETGGAVADEDRFDVAFQSGARPLPEAVAAKLAGTLGQTVEALRAALDRPEGRVLQGLGRAQVDLWHRAMPRLRGLRMRVSNRAVARYDLLPWGRPANHGALALALARLGAMRCPTTGALATELDAPTCEFLMRRFPGAGMRAVNRDFLRFDLLLTGCTGLSPAEMTDFLAARTALPRAELARRGAAPLVIERGLLRDRALLFQAEYAAIGLQTRLRLFGVSAALLTAAPPTSAGAG